ncbi:MAG: fumarylacetoacetate hydrolase family protein [bacterium]|nr:fumarylacetoacetate hydrolase family protein [Betaproteobacteria bacterium]
MKLLTFRPPRMRNPHFGVLLSNGQALDLTASGGRALPGSLMDCIRAGEAGLSQVLATLDIAEGLLARGMAPDAMVALDAVELLAPLRPGKIMAVGRNYADAPGAAEAVVAAAAGASVAPPPRPGGFIKNASCVIGPGETIRKPRWTRKLDYETELAVVIGADCTRVDPERWADVVFGYTIMNDLSARDIQAVERRDGNITVSKNFPGAAPLGPWVVTKDEIPDPHDLRLLTRVNGVARQDGHTGQQIHRIPAQVAWYSFAGFEAGDIVSTGSPGGTGMTWQGPGSWYLEHGHEVECEIEGIGVLRNPVRNARG